jgi:transposase
MTKITTDKVDKILELNGKSLSLREISKIVGLSYETIRKIIGKYKLTK